MPVEQVPIRLGDWRRATAILAIVFCDLGLFTVSWDRFGDLSVGDFNVKMSVVAFGLSAVLIVLAGQFRWALIAPRHITIIVTLMVVVMIIASALAKEWTTGFLTVFRVIVGAFLPAGAVLAIASIERQFREMLKWFVWGALFACGFGLYQIFAFYIGTPQFVNYTGVSGGLGRISSFSYEPAEFGYFLVLAVVAAIVRRSITRTLFSELQIALLLVTLILLNSRAVFLTLPLLLILIRPISSGLISKRKFWVALGSLAGVVLAVCLIVPPIPRLLTSQFLSIFNPNEQASNAPRLQLYDAALHLAAQHFWIGVGPSNFGLYISQLHYAQYAGVSLNKMVVNNVWLQSMMDGGIVLTLAQGALVVLVVTSVYLSKNVNARILGAGWLAVIVVGGMVVSNFYEAKLWVVLALAITAARNAYPTGPLVSSEDPQAWLGRFARRGNPVRAFLRRRRSTD
jgi:O-antigen ligase